VYSIRNSEKLYYVPLPWYMMCMSQIVARLWLRVTDQIGRKLVEIGNLEHL